MPTALPFSAGQTIRKEVEANTINAKLGIQYIEYEVRRTNRREKKMVIVATHEVYADGTKKPYTFDEKQRSWRVDNAVLNAFDLRPYLLVA